MRASASVMYTDLHSQKAVAACLKSEQLLSCGFVRICRKHDTLTRCWCKVAIEKSIVFKKNLYCEGQYEYIIFYYFYFFGKHIVSRS